MAKTASRTTTQCEHCGTPFESTKEERFCCHGCAYVFRLLNENGFGRYYELRGKQSTPPVGSRVFKEAETAWLSEQIKRAEGNDEAIAETTLGIRGLSCVGCVWLIESVFQQQAGAVSIAINASRGALQIRWERGQFSPGNFAQEVQRLGYELTPGPQDKSDSGDGDGVVRRLGACGFFMLNTMGFTLPHYLGLESEHFLSPLFNLLGALFATLSMLVGGSYFIARAVNALRRKVIHIDLPIALGLIAAYLGSIVGWMLGMANLIYFDFVATFVFLMLAGRWVQEFALAVNRRHVNERHPGAKPVTLLGGPNDGAELPAEQITRGTRYCIKRGEINPVSARLVNREAAFSLEWINGEAEPVAIETGKVVPAGAINVSLESAALRAEESWADSLLAKLLGTPPDTFRNQRVQRFLSRYLATIVTVALLGGATWLTQGASLAHALQVFISVLIVSCPCALGVAIPLIDELCNAKLRARGLFIKASTIWERLRRVNHVVFDKTGTLSLDTPRLLNPENLESVSFIAARSLFQLTAGNLHPVARALREELLVTFPSLELKSTTEQPAVHESVGGGVYFTSSSGDVWSLGKPDWRPNGSGAKAKAGTASQSDLRRNGELVAAFLFDDDVRAETRETIAKLRTAGMSVSILSGDVDASVQRMASRVGIPAKDALGRCSPQEKAEWIAQKAPSSAMMIGDGANDRLAFDQAVCRGTPIVDQSILEGTADFFFYGRSLRSITELFAVAQRRTHAVGAVVAFAICYNAVAISFCLSGQMHPLLAAILMPISSLIALVIPWMLLSAKPAERTREQHRGN